MTNEEAIKLIDDRMCFGRGKWSEHHRPVIDEYWQAGEMAIKALEQPEIIRCCECKYLQCNMRPDGYLPKGVDEFECRHWCGSCDPMDFCSYAER